MIASIDYGVVEVIYTTISNCTIAGNIQLVTSTRTPVITGAFTLENDFHMANPDTHTGLNITKLQKLFEHDLNHVFETTLNLADLAPLKWMKNFWWSPWGQMGAQDAFSNSGGGNAASTYESSGNSTPAINNFALFLRSSFPPELFEGLEVNNIFDNLSVYNLPFGEPQPVPFSARYLCHRMWWKTPTNLAVDVLVATTSLFMAYWGVLNFSLRYIAKRSSPHRNHCVCPNCTELSNHPSAYIDMHELHSTDDEPEYKSIPTRTQPTP
ncbi:hypothetical protein BDV93DRAFT_505405 [Ceratobasidium sp. AG-I]|nr:hypothetical protein BDV93DRAFT_505405 [Ceratobasidium sp. AG-I]